MSRNVKQKLPAVATKRRVSASSSPNLSDDDGYSAVEDISDDDDDEDDVDAAEEENILTEASTRPSVAPRPQPGADDQDDDDDDDDDDVDDDDDDDDDDDEDDDDGGQDSDDENGDDFGAEFDEGFAWQGIASDVDDSRDAPAQDAIERRHVRFDVPSSESDSTESDADDDNFFPDIFVFQSQLDPAFRREIEVDPDDSSASGSFWDFGQHDLAGNGAQDQSDDETAALALPPSMPTAVDPMPAPEESRELEGYETDGDTTEEDIPEPLFRRRTRRPSSAMSDASESSDVVASIKAQRGQPRVGRFSLDRSEKKPIAVLNPLTRKMMIFTPTRRRQLDLSPEQFNLPWPTDVQQSSPLFTNSVMLSAMVSSNTFGDFVNSQTVGSADAPLPTPSDANTADSSEAGPSDEDDGEKTLDIDDFITWGDDDSSGDEARDSGKWEPSSTPARPTTSSGDGDALPHLNPDTVGAFRRNQKNQQLILSNQATLDSLAFSGPYNYTALRGIKSGRFDTARLPLTPIRRQKRHVAEAAGSPLDSISAKRKASAEAVGGHKRQRSISDVNMLSI
ncbi:amidase [Ophiocordyceps camponoti-floridani]|uniref:Amidase n=1 Tax=Ophiocordyceps camponoti-floridani TaxID=2030778 RepID=A0A8H4Q746_9HYPO|nr:amidase [Ophiocordyceps camponoti-floridani]